MVGVVVILVVMILVVPPIIFVGGALVAAVVGWALKNDAETRYEGSELVELHR